MTSTPDKPDTDVAAGYTPEVVEKVRRLLLLLDALRSHPFLKERVALKGGSALNLFLWDVPRLSVDVDLNFIGSADREAMLADRPRMDQAVEAVCGRLGITVRRMPEDHAGGKWRLGYVAEGGRTGTLELDVNFLDRVRLWPALERDSRVVAGAQARNVLVLDAHELAAGKLAALLARDASRDLFDARKLLRDESLERGRLRLAFVVYGGMNRKDWRTVSKDDARVTVRDVQTQLVPVLRRDVAPARGHVDEWTLQLVEEVRDRLSVILPLEAHEHDFLDRLNDRGEIAPELLTDAPGMQETLRSHPGLLWKAQNVRRHRGLAQTGTGGTSTSHDVRAIGGPMASSPGRARGKPRGDHRRTGGREYPRPRTCPRTRSTARDRPWRQGWSPP